MLFLVCNYQVVVVVVDDKSGFKLSVRLPQNRKEDLFAEVSSLVHHMFLLTESRLRNRALIFFWKKKKKKELEK